MSHAWDRASDRLDLLHRAFPVLGRGELPARVLAVSADLPVEVFQDVPATGAHPSGLIRTGPDAFGPHRPTEPPDPPWDEATRDLAARVGEDVLATLATAGRALGRPPAGFDHRATTTTGLPPVRFADRERARDWVRANLGLLPAVVRACANARSRALAVAVAAHSWTCAPGDAPPAWAHDLSEAGADAAIADRAPRSFTGLMRLGAQWFADRGDIATAERLGVREWAAWERLADTDGMIDVLWHRAGVYAAAGHEDRELDCYVRLRSLYEAGGDHLGVVRTTAATGTAFARLGSDQDALEHLSQAAQEFAALPGTTPVEQATVLITLGRVHWTSGDHYAARRRFHAAHRLLADADRAGPAGRAPVEALADQVRRLLDTEAGRSLPDG
ncbi:tetratricopeptide repeat protein [Actinosynnema sp. NPDC023587]|uniref:tetratricopeptide repeat protein n=1 Tax=Actinosynnema sp. NPDC023587 TaxID=3154695 RepID=UPI00341121AD